VIEFLGFVLWNRMIILHLVTKMYLTLKSCKILISYSTYVIDKKSMKIAKVSYKIMYEIG